MLNTKIKSRFEIEKNFEIKFILNGLDIKQLFIILHLAHKTKSFSTFQVCKYSREKVEAFNIFKGMVKTLETYGVCE